MYGVRGVWLWFGGVFLTDFCCDEGGLGGMRGERGDGDGDRIR